jgi:predicted nucleic acid-binding protein
VTALDASVLIAYLRRADAHHERAIELVLDAGELVAHPITLAEVLVGAVRRGRGEELVETLRGLGVRQATVDAGQPLRLAELRAASALKLPDCCVLDLAITERTALATFDGALAEAARLHGVEVAGA